MQGKTFQSRTMNARHYISTPDGQLCFILALKVCEGLQDFAHNIYIQAGSTTRLLLKQAPWESWGGDGRYHLQVSAHTVCVLITDWQTEWGARQAIAVWQMPCTNTSHRLDVKRWAWDEAFVWQLGWMRAKEENTGVTAVARGWCWG